MKASAENRRVGNLIKSIREESLHPRPDFQRRTVWTNPDKVLTALTDTLSPEQVMQAMEQAGFTIQAT